MKLIKLGLTVLIIMVISFLLIVGLDFETMFAKENPKELYQVYLDGNKIGVIESKEALENYINEKQQEVKNKYGVSYVYPPKNLHIQKYISYNDKIVNEDVIYEIIKEKNPFTIKGYVVTINGEKPKTIKILDRDLFIDAVNTTIEAFVPKEKYQQFINETQEEIKTIGNLIEDIYIKEKITIKEDYIDVDDNILTDKDELSKYLLFGTLEQQKQYIVQEGDTIENVAFNNNLGTGEFLLVNPDISSENTLLSLGQTVTVGAIDPLFNVVVEEHVVEDKVQQYKTEVVYNPTLAYGRSIVKRKGVNGTERVVQKLKKENGQILNALVINTEVIKPAVDEIIERGTKYNIGNVIISSDGKWAWPTKTPYIITSSYSWRRHPITTKRQFHAAIDISGTGQGSPIFAAREGTIFKVGYNSSLGNNIIIKHDNNYYTLYAHLSRTNVKFGAHVSQGQVIGGMGKTGSVTGTHLHFAVWIGEPYSSGSAHINPMLLYK
ncbi:MAG: peptidoglycan DD-metalloendopeptidase family protein [Bacilli bacterium]|nr:peptidoglycan DD-metalloendopeptidase family protein [Bacilli bacterium]